MRTSAISVSGWSAVIRCGGVLRDRLPAEHDALKRALTDLLPEVKVTSGALVSSLPVIAITITMVVVVALFLGTRIGVSER
ncbi:hypothetical protein [Paractinoplanes toevensis]|uniref:Uncharacterized protein n=1 Tax=Paractinoplanes toevensis TaxID=571911 RepID=A0A920BPI8_9ACTN|nr:hypothetical protein [Actinoplanes toevensis]GIM96807.1 hypothetical protein Ato02nite_086000 [Actinoplanes toevensis]